MSLRLWFTPDAVDISSIADEARLKQIVQVLEGMGAKQLKAWVELMDGRMAIPLDEPGTYLVMRLES